MDRKELKSKIPYGYSKIIAQRAGVTQKSVSMYLNDKLNSHKIEMATLQVLSDIGKSKSILIANIL